MDKEPGLDQIPRTQSQSEGFESLDNRYDGTYIQTERGAFRGEIVRQTAQERIIKIEWSRDGKGTNAFLKLDAGSLQRSEPFRFAVSLDGETYGPEQSSTKLESAARWERGVRISLEELYRRTSTRELSQNLHSNTLKSEEEHRYGESLPEYEYIKEASFYSSQNQDGKCLLAYGASEKGYSPNVGWKVHLDVIPENAVAVSSYLKQNGYAHKYLTGGSGTEGKAFTVYFGAKFIMDRWVPRLSHDLNQKLCRPRVNGEIANEMELEAGIVGRFVALEKESADPFLQYGYYGMSARREFVVDHKLSDETQLKSEDKRAIAQDAYQHLSDRYGSYFTG